MVRADGFVGANSFWKSWLLPQWYDNQFLYYLMTCIKRLKTDEKADGMELLRVKAIGPAYHVFLHEFL